MAARFVGWCIEYGQREEFISGFWCPWNIVFFYLWSTVCLVSFRASQSECHELPPAVIKQITSMFKGRKGNITAEYEQTLADAFIKKDEKYHQMEHVIRNWREDEEFARQVSICYSHQIPRLFSWCSVVLMFFAACQWAQPSEDHSS